MSTKGQTSLVDTTIMTENTQHSDNTSPDLQMTIGGEILASNEITDDSNLIFDWETSEILHIVKTFPISDYGTKSDDDESLSGFLVPEPPSPSGIIDSTIDKSSSSETTDVEENYVEDDMSSLTDITDVKVSNAPMKHEFAKERIEREGNTYDKLYNASLKGQISIVKGILENHNATLMLDENGQTPLYAACIGTHSEVIDLLINSGCDINHKDNEGKTPLHIAFENHASDLAETLITQFNANIEIRDINNWTPLHTAIDRGYFIYSQQLSQMLLQDVGSDVSWIQLHAACYNADTRDVQTLLDINTDVNHASSAGHTPLHIAVAKCNIDLVTLLLDHNADANTMTSNRQTPLHIAVDKGEETIIQKLLASKADPNLKDVVGNTSLHLAVQTRDTKPGFFKAEVSLSIRNWHCFPTTYLPCSVQTVQTIIDHEADVNAMNSRGQTSLWFACCNGQKEYVKILLDTGADPNIVDKNEESCLHAAIYGSCCTETTQNIIDHGAQVNSVNKDGATALLLACRTAQKQSVKLLLKAQADPNIPDSDGDTSLHEAIAADCDKETLQEIIDCGANVNAVNKRGMTALLLGCSFGHMDSVKVLLEAGADPNVIDKIGYSCMFAAVDGRCSREILQELMEHGAHVDTKRKDGTTALLCACRTGQSESVKFLLEAGADANISKPDGNTSLHIAVSGNCSKEALQKLIENGVSINAVNNKNMTALTLACELAKTEHMNLLLEKGSDPNICDVYGNTSLHLAVHGCCTHKSLQDIITHQVYVNAQNNNGQTALLLACIYRQQNMIKLLLENGSYADIPDNAGNTSLHTAVLRNCSKRIIRTIIESGANVNATNKQKRTALMSASKKN